jgi:hypothetical protein
MTLSFRNALLALAFGVLLLLAAGYGLLAFLLVTREGWSAPVGQGTVLTLIAQTALLPVGGVVGFLLVRRAFRKSAAPEAFFFALFLVAFAGESLLLLQAWINFEGFAAYFTSLLTRIVWAFRFTGLGFLLCGSLFGFDFTFRKYGNLVALSVAGGVFLAVLLPLHSSSARNHLLFAVGDAPGMVLVTILLAVVVAANYLMGARRPGAPDRAWPRAWASVFYLAAWGLAISMGPWGAILAIPGVVLTAWRTEQSPLSG